MRQCAPWYWAGAAGAAGAVGAASADTYLALDQQSGAHVRDPNIIKIYSNCNYLR